jgi:hypothetical protein
MIDQSKYLLIGATMSESSNASGNDKSGWRLEYYPRKNVATGGTIKQPIMTKDLCQIKALKRPGPLGHHFKYEEAWMNSMFEFEFEAIFVGGISSTTYQVFLGAALERHPEYWGGSPQDNALLDHLMANIREALSLLRSGPTEESRITRVEFVLSDSPHWQRLSDFQSQEIVR